MKSQAHTDLDILAVVAREQAKKIDERLPIVTLGAFCTALSGYDRGRTSSYDWLRRGLS